MTYPHVDEPDEQSATPSVSPSDGIVSGEIPPVAQPPTRPKSLLSSAAWNIVAMVIIGLVGFVTVPIVVRAIGESDYGLYLLVGSIGGFATLLDLGMGEATLKFTAQYYARGDIRGVNRVVGATLSIYAVTGIVGGAIIIGGAPWIVRLLRLEPRQLALAADLVRWSGLAFVLWVVAGAVRTMPDATQRYDIAGKVRIVMAVIQGVAVVAAVKLGYGVTGLVVWMVANSLLNIIVAVVIAKMLVPGLHPWPRPTREGLREVFGYGVFSSVNQVIGTISMQADRLILGAFFGTAEIAILEVPKGFLLRGVGVFSAAGAALFPRFSAMKEGPAMRDLFLNSTWALLCFSLVLFVPTMVVLPEFLRLWMGPEFAAQSATVSQIIAASMALQGAFVPIFGLLKGTARVHWLMIIYIVTSGVSLGAAVVLIPIFGVMGGGYRQWVTVWMGFVIVLILCRKVFPAAGLRAVAVMCLAVPVAVATLCGGAFWASWSVAALHGWVWMILAWIAMASVLAACLWAANRVLTGPDGAAAQLLTSAKMHLRGSAGSVAGVQRK